MSEIVPQVGAWYRLPDGKQFEVVAIDERDRTVDVQHYDGTVEEWDLESWDDLMPEPAEAPEDWAGSLDVEKEDYGVAFDEEPHEQWANPLDYLDLAE
jgi:hypothetical protein